MKVSSFDPGWVKTDMGTMDGVREPEVAGKEIVDLVERDIDSGYFWYQGTIRDW